jgi:hypothetical protein
MAANEREIQTLALDLHPEQALLSGKLQGLVATAFINERPLQGLLGLLDWRLGGELSNFIRRGTFSGVAGESVYFPFTRVQRGFHLFVVGAGVSASPGQRDDLSGANLSSLRKNLLALKLDRIGISSADFGGAKPDFFAQNFKGVPLWIVQ